MDISLSETETDIARHIRTETDTSSIYCGTETEDNQSQRHTQTKINKPRHIQVIIQTYKRLDGHLINSLSGKHIQDRDRFSFS